MPSSQPTAGARIRIGCAGLPQGLRRQRYFEQLSFLETAATFASLPRPSVLRRWREEASEKRPKDDPTAAEARFALVALSAITDPASRFGAARSAGASATAGGDQLGHFRDTAAVREATAAVAAAARELDAEAVLFRTPPSFTPSTANRDALRRYFETVAPPGTFGQATLVWEPQGLWELDDAVRLGSEVGLRCACDPLARDPTMPEVDPTEGLPSDAAYFRVTGLGGPQRPLDEGTLEALLLQAERFERCWLVFATLERRADALNCQKLLSALGADE